MGMEVQFMFRYVECIDAGSEYCPCYLAEHGECIICSQLKGKEFCDCLNWSGTCIYQEYLWNNEKGKKPRQFVKCRILSKQYIREDVFILKIKVPKSMARILDNIGAYVFLRKNNDDVVFSTPISVAESDSLAGVIKVMIKVNGIKTKAIDECSDFISVKGPYLNGIQGQRFIRDVNNGKMLFLIRGTAGISALMAAKKCIKDNEIDVLIDKGRHEKNFLEDYFSEVGCAVNRLSFLDEKGLSDEGKYKIKEYIKNKQYDVALSAGNDGFHSQIINYINKIDENIKFATVNNSIICCGEGICGSCTLSGISNSSIKSCKQQYNPMELFLKADDSDKICCKKDEECKL